MGLIKVTEAQELFPELLSAARRGEAIEILQDDGWIYRLTAVPPPSPRPRPPVTGRPKAGRWKGQIIIPPEFDEPLKELREYME